MVTMKQRVPHGRYRAQSTAVGIIAILASVVAGGCSSQEVYGAGQAWQRQECSKMTDSQDRGRCMASASRSYDEYKRDAEAAKGSR